MLPFATKASMALLIVLATLVSGVMAAGGQLESGPPDPEMLLFLYLPVKHWRLSLVVEPVKHFAFE